MAAGDSGRRQSLHRHMLHPPGSSSRYAAFDGSTESGPGRRSKSAGGLSNKWEIVLVTIIVAAGIVITTIAAIKASGTLFNSLARAVDLKQFYLSKSPS